MTLKIKNKSSWKWTILWTLWAARLVRQPTLEIRTESGLVRGYVSHDGTHSSFLGIPYATVGPEHRFKAAGPPLRWKGTFDAVNEHIRCPQRVGSSVVIGMENCLVLNIHTPANTPPDAKLPVMVFIHGGGFFSGSGSKFLYGPRHIVSKGVILVTINYRLNIQGFLCLRIKDAPGNAAMKDQVAALRWVQKNIRAFGGDPDNVTLFGESAGGASVSYHVLSPMSKGLFHKAIMQSGSALAPWAYQLRPVYMASLLTKTMGYNTEDPDELYRILLSKTDEELILTRVPRKEGNVVVSEVLYAPCTEAVIKDDEQFLTEVPYEALMHGNFNKVPLIIGSNSEEGFLFGSMENETTIPKIAIERALPKDMTIPAVEEIKAISENFQKLYLGADKISKNTLIKLSKFVGELYFNLPALTETELILQSTDEPVYSYLFDYSGWRNLVKLTTGKPFSSSSGATHADDLFYLFGMFKMTFDFFETEMINTMTTLWTNFAKYGDPTPSGSRLQWEPATREGPQSLVLGSSAHTQPLWHSETLLYWRELYQKYRRKDYL